MRLWHKDLIPVLPSQQLIAQWRECCAIARNIYTIGSPNHILVNRIMDYPISHFYAYTHLVIDEMGNHNFAITMSSYNKYEDYIFKIMERTNDKLDDVPYESLFLNWHNDKYFWQCLYNLQEKYDCGAIKDEDMDKINELAVFYV